MIRYNLTLDFSFRLQIKQMVDERVVSRLNEMSAQTSTQSTLASVARKRHIDSNSSQIISVEWVDSSKRKAAAIEPKKDPLVIDDDEALQEAIQKVLPLLNNKALPDEDRKEAPTIPSTTALPDEHEKDKALLDDVDKDFFDENGDDEDDSDDDEVAATDNVSPLKKKRKTEPEVLDGSDSSDDSSGDSTDDASVDDTNFVQDD